MNNRLKSGFKSIANECCVETINSLTKQFVRMTIGAAITYFVLGFIFPDKEENEE
jgi:hypothetical protein